MIFIWTYLLFNSYCWLKQIRKEEKLEKRIEELEKIINKK
jgi:hypothetical protein